MTAPASSSPSALAERGVPYAAGFVLVVTDRSQVAPGRDLLDVVASSLEGGAHGVLVRERDLPGPDRAALIESAGALCKAHDAVLLVASPVTMGAGVHLRRDEPAPPDRADRVVGRSCHDLAELRRACDDSLDHVTLSPVAPTASKPGYGPAIGVAGLRHLTARIRSERSEVPAILAFGGVTPGNAGSWIEAGADGVAVMGAVMRAADPAATTRTIVESVATAWELAR